MPYPAGGCIYPGGKGGGCAANIIAGAPGVRAPAPPRYGARGGYALGGRCVGDKDRREGGVCGVRVRVFRESSCDTSATGACTQIPKRYRALIRANRLRQTQKCATATGARTPIPKKLSPIGSFFRRGFTSRQTQRERKSNHTCCPGLGAHGDPSVHGDRCHKDQQPIPRPLYMVSNHRQSVGRAQNYTVKHSTERRS